MVNEWTQSHSEFTCMCFQTAPNATVIGSQTAGADGSGVYGVFSWQTDGRACRHREQRELPQRVDFADGGRSARALPIVPQMPVWARLAGHQRVLRHMEAIYSHATGNAFAAR